jgi:hypothetical protein
MNRVATAISSPIAAVGHTAAPTSVVWLGVRHSLRLDGDLGRHQECGTSHRRADDVDALAVEVLGSLLAEAEVGRGIAPGMFGYLGGALFTLMVGALATSIGYEPLFALLFVFDVVAALTLWAFIGVRQGQIAEQPAG